MLTLLKRTRVRPFLRNFSSKERDIYSSDQHSLLPYLFTYPFSNDNYGYLLLDPQTKQLLAVDTGDFEASKYIVEKVEKKFDARLKFILSTHRHLDHIGANENWLKERNDIEVVSGTIHDGYIPGISKTMEDLETMQVGDLAICCMHTPGHTSEHVSYVVTHVNPDSTKIPFLFPGDTLFIGGCGRLLAGTAEQLFYSLQKLINLPQETLIFCAHEYTENNLKFAQALEPENEAIQMKLDYVRQVRQKGGFTVGGKLMEERMTNPFIRCTDPYYEDLTGESDPVLRFAKLRKLKDTWKG